MDALVDYLLNFQGPVIPYLIVLGILLACGVGLPIPEDITLIAAGLLAYYESVNLYVMLAICFIGVVAGDTIVFFLGKTFGRKLTRMPVFRKILTPGRLLQVSRKFHYHGNKILFVARFTPGLRAPVFFTAGTLRLPFRVFIFYDGLAAIISVPLIVYLSFYFGDTIDHFVKVAQGVKNGIFIAVVLFIGLLIAKYFWGNKKSSEKEEPEVLSDSL